MKIIILYTSAGAGHWKAAQSIYNELRKSSPSFDLKLIDALDHTNIFFKKSYTIGYSFLVSYLSWLWGLLFYLTAFRPARRVINIFRFLIDIFNTAKLRSFLAHHNPDLIISTHFLPSYVASYLKGKKKVSSRLITVITDFGLHYFWLAKNTDLYAVASDFTRKFLLKEMVPEEKIMVSGIPIDDKFRLNLDRKILAQELSIEENKFTVLIVTGSFGIGPIEQIADFLHNDVQILVVCAKNKKLFRRLSAKIYPAMKVFSFVDNIEELMAVSDMIVTKPGGLTISEVLAMELPPLFISSIPGQENINADFLIGQGIAKNISDIHSLRDTVLDYKNNPQKLAMIKEKIRRIKKPDAAGEIYHAVCSGSSRPSC